MITKKTMGKGVGLLLLGLIFCAISAINAGAQASFGGPYSVFLYAAEGKPASGGNFATDQNGTAAFNTALAMQPSGVAMIVRKCPGGALVIAASNVNPNDIRPPLCGGWIEIGRFTTGHGPVTIGANSVSQAGGGGGGNTHGLPGFAFHNGNWLFVPGIGGGGGFTQIQDANRFCLGITPGETCHADDHVAKGYIEGIFDLRTGRWYRNFGLGFFVDWEGDSGANFDESASGSLTSFQLSEVNTWSATGYGLHVNLPVPHFENHFNLGAKIGGENWTYNSKGTETSGGTSGTSSSTFNSTITGNALLYGVTAEYDPWRWLGVKFDVDGQRVVPPSDESFSSNIHILNLWDYRFGLIFYPW